MTLSSPPLRWVAAGLLAIATTGTGGAAHADPTNPGFSRAARHAGSLGEPVHASAPRSRIGSFAAYQRWKARQALRLEALEREHARRLMELRDRGDRLALERYRRESEAAELPNSLAFRHELRQLDAFLAREKLGPITRRVLDRHRAALLERQSQLRRQRALEEARREADAAEPERDRAPFLRAPP